MTVVKSQWAGPGPLSMTSVGTGLPVRSVQTCTQLSGTADGGSSEKSHEA